MNPPSPKPIDRRLIHLTEAAQILGISLRTLRALMGRGALPFVRPSARRVAIDVRDLERYIDAQREGR